MGSLRRWNLVLVLLAGGAAGCRLTTDWDVAENSPPFVPVFELRNTFGVPVEIHSAVVVVETCEPDPLASRTSLMWAVDLRFDTTAPRPYRIRYGQAPPAYRQRAPARPLVPGCYFVGAGGTPYSRFDVDFAGIARKVF